MKQKFSFQYMIEMSQLQNKEILYLKGKITVGVEEYNKLKQTLEKKKSLTHYLKLSETPSMKESEHLNTQQHNVLSSAECLKTIHSRQKTPSSLTSRILSLNSCVKIEYKSKTQKS